MSRPCPSCGRKVRVGIPKGGDGSVEVYSRHKSDMKQLSRCPMSWQIVPSDCRAERPRTKGER
jgi:hypothetical protein